jgi:ParB family chromosome partitioning protein
MPPRAKPAAKKPAATPRKRKIKPAAGSVGLEVAEVTGSAPTAAASRLRAQIEAAGGAEIAAYREPFGGFWVALAALPLDRVKPTPYQRELSKTHAERLATVIPKVGRSGDRRAR